MEVGTSQLGHEMHIPEWQSVSEQFRVYSIPILGTALRSTPTLC